MTSKIDGFDGRPAKVGASQPVQRQREIAPDARGPGQSASEGVQITSSASQLASLEQALKRLPEIDEGRVAEVRAALDEGRYTVSPERVADKLLGMEHLLARLDRDGR